MHEFSGEAAARWNRLLRSRSSTDQTAQAAVGENFAAGLTCGAIGDFVGLVGDTAEVVDAAGAGGAVPAVHDESGLQLGWQAARALALAGEGVVEDVLGGRQWP